MLTRKNPIGPALFLLVGLTGAGTPTIPDLAKGSCRTIAAILVVYPALQVRLSEGAVPDPRAGIERYGCRVHAAGPVAGMAGEVPPGEPIRFLLGESGWEEDPDYTADGPGTASFALRKDGVLCLFSGGIPSWIEDGKNRTSGTFEFEAGCTAGPE